MSVKKTAALALIGGVAIVTFQNCAVPLDSLAEQYSLDDSNPTAGGELESGPVAYLYQSGDAKMVKDVCLSDNNYVLKVRNSGSNPRLCLTKRSEPGACTNSISSFISIVQAGYQRNGADWVNDGVGDNLKQLFLPSQAPISMTIFYIDDENPKPKPVGEFSVHACADKIVYNHVSFSCPSEDICANYFPQTSMETGSCVFTTGGVRVTCVPSFVEPGSPMSGSFAKFKEPLLSSSLSEGGPSFLDEETEDSDGSNTGNVDITPGGVTSNPIECGSIPKSTSVFDWPHYYNPGTVLETKTIKQGTSRAFKFIANRSIYPDGQQLQFETTVYAGGSNRMDFTVSPCPGLFTSVQKRCSYTRVKATSINLGFDPSDETKCVLEDGKEYYLNIKPTDGNSEVAKVVGSQRL